MASSVSSERAFSQEGLTISKRRSRLKGDIVEALQCVKCSIRQDLLFAEPGPSSITEAMEDSENDSGNEDGADDFVWDELLIDEDKDDGIEMSDSQ